MNARDFLPDDKATALLAAGWVMHDAETLLDQAPACLLRRIARNVGMIDRVTLWDTQDPEDGFALTMSDANEAYAEWADHMNNFLEVSPEVPV
jgi:hypothetical protein